MNSLRIAVPALAVLLTTAGFATPSPAGLSPAPDMHDPIVHMAWGAPWGMPGAKANLEPACGDSARRDTLYLSFEPTQDESSFVGVGGEIEILAAPGDTLGTFWDMAHGGANAGGIVAQFQLGGDAPGPSPWNAQGSGSVTYERTTRKARFKFGSVIGMFSGKPLTAHTRYTAGWIILGRRGHALTGCETPVCISWWRGEFVFGPHRDLFPDLGEGAVVTRGVGAPACKASPPDTLASPPKGAAPGR